MDDWHRALGVVSGGLSWEPSRWRPMAVEMSRENPETEPAFWELTELTSSAQLRAEGAALQHWRRELCVPVPARDVTNLVAASAPGGGCSVHCDD